MLPGQSIALASWFARMPTSMSAIAWVSLISLRPVIKENTTRVVAAQQNNISLPWHAILNHTSHYDVISIKLDIG